MGEVVNKNLQAITIAFEMVDNHMFIHRRVLNDMLHGRVRTTPVHPEDAATLDEFPTRRLQTLVSDSSIDYEWYAKQLEGMKTLAAMMTWLQRILGVEVAVQVEEDFEFGGPNEGAIHT